ETPGQAAGTAAPLRIGRFMVPMHARSESRLSMSRAVVGQVSRLSLGRLAPGFVAGETPAQAAGTAAPLRIGRFMVPMRANCGVGALHEPARQVGQASCLSCSAGFQPALTGRMPALPSATVMVPMLARIG